MLAAFHFPLTGQIQSEDTTNVYQTESYEVRVKKSHINGVYIPINLNNAMSELDKKMDENAKKSFAAYTEEEAESKAFFTFGRWMLVNWGLEDGSRLSLYFTNKNLGVVEDMIRVLMVSYHRHLNKRPLDEEKLLQKYRDKRLEAYELRLKTSRKDTLRKS